MGGLHSMSKNYRTSGVPKLAQSSWLTWTNYEKVKPVKAENRNGKVKTIKSKKRLLICRPCQWRLFNSGS